MKKSEWSVYISQEGGPTRRLFKARTLRRAVVFVELAKEAARRSNRPITAVHLYPSANGQPPPIKNSSSAA